jgi:polysaccharide deacetylase 2 family uncharacterized protein YibQ
VTKERGELNPQRNTSYEKHSSEEPHLRFLPTPLLRAFPLVCLLIAICLLGCGDKSIRKNEIRTITSEIVAAAQKTTQRKSEIAIRPEVQSADAGANRSPADDVYVTLTDASQADSLKQALDEIAHRHTLSVSATNSDSVQRFDFFFNGTRTHTVHVVTPVAARAHQPVPLDSVKSGPKLAIILDDMGYDRAAADAAFALQFPITLSVIPHLPHSAEVAEEAYRRGDQVLLHLPMEAEAGEKAEPIELRVGMKADQVERDLDGMLETVPHAAGVNNHQGSRATADAKLMGELMPALRRRGLFFVDSRTTAATVAYDAAERAGVRSASRKVFLDDMTNRDAILSQIDLAARDATRDGFAIAIGHPHPATIAALVEAVPRLEASGMRFVFVSQVVQ